MAGPTERAGFTSLLLAFSAPLILASAAPRESRAAWPHSPGTNLPVCTAANGQYFPTIVSDGSGGAIVTWYDLRGGSNTDIYAQHLLASGAVDPAWPADGRALCTAASDQVLPTIVSDGAGGAIVTWYDARSGNSDIYAQHVLASGAVDGAWPADGRALCTAASSQNSPTIVSDGAGGAIVTWYDSRGGPADIYAQHVLASGAVDGAWPANGRALCTAANSQEYPTIVSDGAGGAIVTWNDYRGGLADIYAQHVLASGAVDGAWPADGRALCTAANYQLNPTIVSDGAGGAIVAWFDLRGGVYYDIYAQHVLASGAVDGAWPADGRALCTTANHQEYPTIVSDGAGGAIVTWYDYRSGPADIYAQHVLASGAVDGAWPADGRALCTAAGDQASPTIVLDGAGGAIVTWTDYRSGVPDIYAQHVLASGAVDAAWPAQGQALCTAANNQYTPTIVSDGAGGAIVPWYDYRGGPTSSDIYAQRIAPSGYLGNPEPRISSVHDVPNDNGGKVKLSWTASYLDTEQPYGVDHYAIFRNAPPNSAAQALAAGARLLRAGEAGPHGGERAFFATTVSSATYYWEYLASVVAAHFASAYSYTAPTTSDSIAAGNPKTAFLVVAFNAGNTVYLASNPDSGYSVDNVPPTAPAPFTGYFSGLATNLHWGVNAESDFSLYHLYSGATAGFTPGPGNLVTAQSDTGYFDSSTAWAYYKLSALDIHGNESGFALVSPSATFSGNTAPGTNVPVTLPGVQLTFGSVTSGGQTQVVLKTGGPAPPSGFEVVPTSPTLYYGITTTATFTGLVKVCVNYNPAYVIGKETKLKLKVYDTTLPGWKNITTTRDTAANVICGTTTHFSDFAVMLPLDLVGVDDAIPAGLQLYPCAPNPTTGGSAVRFALPRDSDVRLAIFDAGGRRVRELARGALPAGEHTLRWDGRDASGRPVANGLYLVRLEADGVALTQKLVSMR